MATESIIREYKDEIAGVNIKLTMGIEDTGELLYYSVTTKTGLNLPKEAPDRGVINCDVFGVMSENRRDAYIKFGKIVTKAMKSGYLR